ncbi:hypothetical protein [Vannielia litorea]|uniref:hypothetical protein n=1 Tax=Vannielia litorea TaxID=1217970 RepID=UPI001C98715F|nr:hypothetical protein [Vannielia litorea]MBY6046818.1 hypothetical protein [Vannielia litorea]MBY6074232.1 hypothetical protein [Vannielia litorea]
MVDVSEIDGRKTLQLWLKDRPKDWSVWIAHRAAMRALPVVWSLLRNTFSPPGDVAELQILRALLVSDVASLRPTGQIRRAARSADAAADTVAASLTDDRTAEISNAVAHAANAAVQVTGHVANAAANAAGRVAYSTSPEEVWNAVRWDCANLVESGFDKPWPLWPQNKGPFYREWRQLRLVLSASGSRQQVEDDASRIPQDWSFWVRWYDAALEGRPLNLDTLEKIALIPAETWDKGPSEVNCIIAKFQEGYDAGAVTPLAKASTFEFAFDPIKHWMKLIGFESDLKSIDNPEKVAAFEKDVQELLEQLEDFTDYARDALGGGNQRSPVLSGAEKLAEELRRACDRKEIRVMALIQKGAYFNGFAQELDAEQVLGPTLARMLEDVIDHVRRVSATHLASGLVRLGPLKELELGERSPAEVLARIKAAWKTVEGEAGSEFARLSPEGEAAFNAMLDDLEELESLIEAAPTEAREQRLRKRFAERVGAFASTTGRYVEKGKEHAPKATNWVDGLIKNYKRMQSMGDIIEWLEKIFGGGPPPV